MTSAGRTTSIPSGLAVVEASFATNLVGAAPTEQVMPCSSKTRARMYSPISAASPEPTAGAPDVEERLVERERLDQRGDRAEQRHDRPRDLGVERHVARQHGGRRAQPQRAGRRHRRVHAVPPGLVGGRGDHPAVARAADDHRRARELRALAHLDAGEEGVHVDVQDGAPRRPAAPRCHVASFVRTDVRIVAARWPERPSDLRKACPRLAARRSRRIAMIDSTGAPPGCDGATRRTAMTTIPENDPPRGGTPLDDAMAGRDAGDEPLVGGDGGADAGAGAGGARTAVPTAAQAGSTPPPRPRRTSASPERRLLATACRPDLRSSLRIGMIVLGGQRSDGPRTAAGATTGSEMTWHSTTTT